MKHKQGDRVQLRWYGDRNLPKFLGYDWATVLYVTKKGNLVVMPDKDSKPRKISPQRHIL